MPALFVFLIKVNVALLVFCAGYYLVLRRLTFYALNRIYLVAAILFASVYPKINLSTFFQRHSRIGAPVQNIVLHLQNPAKDLIRPLTKPNYWQYAEVLFWAGAILLAFRLLIQFISLARIYRNSKAGKINGHKVRVIKGDVGPFSFWNNIYINPEMHEPADLKSILLHEQIHVNEWHTLDILIAEISTIFYWFNPGIWLMKKAVRENIEFITDRKILNNGVDTKQYQYSLVNVSFSAAPQAIVNHFNISTIKKRIIMMNAKRSSKINLTRYAILVPVVVALLLVFTVSKATLIKKSRHSLNTLVTNIKIFKTANFEKFAQSKIVKTVNIKTADTIVRQKAVATNGKDISANLTLSGKGNVYIIRSSNPDTVNLTNIQTIDTPRITGVRINGIDLKPVELKQINGLTVADTVTKLKLIKIGKQLKTDTNNHVEVHTYSQWQTSGNLKPAKLNYTFSSGNSFSLNHLADKLIIINGNIATEADLKKLSAFDIDRMVLKTDEETKDLYGDKAKNGVVFILTKKK